jgi:SAM-dependent methyltransferase
MLSDADTSPALTSKRWKWWREELEPGSASYADALRRLERTNATAAVPIETAGNPQPRVQSGTVGERFVDDAHRQQFARFVNEEHHRQYTSWAMGKCFFESLLVAGIRPEHRVLDFGCGALRIGLWLIRYLEEGKYFGMDAHLPSLEAAVAYELPLHGLEPKRPRLLWNDDLSLSHFETTFDWIVDQNGARRVRPKDLRPVAYERFATVLSKGGRLLTSPRPVVSIEGLEGCELVFSRQWRFEDCPFTSEPEPIRWWEFARADG